MEKVIMISENIDTMVCKYLNEALRQIAMKHGAYCTFESEPVTYRNNDEIHFSALSTPIQMSPVMFKEVTIDLQTFKVNIETKEDNDWRISCSGHLDWDWKHFDGGENGTELTGVDIKIHVHKYDEKTIIIDCNVYEKPASIRVNNY